jgi:hypothetical protein
MNLGIRFGDLDLTLALLQSVAGQLANKVVNAPAPEVLS